MKIPMIPRPSAIRELRANSSPTSLPTLSLCSTRNFASGNFSSSNFSNSIARARCAANGQEFFRRSLSPFERRFLQIDLLQRAADVAFVTFFCASRTSRSPPLKSTPKFFSPRNGKDDYRDENDESRNSHRETALPQKIKAR